MLEEFVKEIQELKEYKKKFEYAEQAKQTMSDRLYDLMMFKYERTSLDQRKRDYVADVCDCCRYRGIQGDESENDPACGVDLPENIGMPSPSDKAWIPGTKTCGHFEWD